MAFSFVKKISFFECKWAISWLVVLYRCFYVGFAEYVRIWLLCRYQKLVEGGLGNIPPQQEGTRSPGKYVIINDEADGASEHGDDMDHVL